MKIEIKNLGYRYPEGRQIFSGINFTIEPGRVIAILGPNGAGKTTLLSCIANLLRPTEGEILIDGVSTARMSSRNVAKAIGFVPQTIIPSFSFSVLDYVVTGCAPHMGTFARPKREHYEIAMEAIRTMGIEYLTEKSYSNISGGERQQVSIARALAQRPSIILMDEPTAHLDYGNQIKVLRTAKRLCEEGFGVVFTTHNPDHVLLLDDQIAVLNRAGALAFGACDAIINEPFLQDLYGTELRLMNIPEIQRKICVSPRI